MLVTPAGGLHVQAPSAEAAEACVGRELPPARRSAEVARRAAVRSRLRLVLTRDVPPAEQLEALRAPEGG